MLPKLLRLLGLGRGQAGMRQIAAHRALEGDLATTKACFSMNNPRSRGGATHWRRLDTPLGML